MKKSTRDRILIISNFSITLYFLLIYLLIYFNYTNPVINFLHELLSLSVLMAAFIFFILGILRLIKPGPTPLFILSFILLSITNILITYSFFSG